MFAVSLMPSARRVQKMVTLPKFVVVNLWTTVSVLSILRTKDQIGLILWRLPMSISSSTHPLSTDSQSSYIMFSVILI